MITSTLAYSAAYAAAAQPFSRSFCPASSASNRSPSAVLIARLSLARGWPPATCTLVMRVTPGFPLRCVVFRRPPPASPFPLHLPPSLPAAATVRSASYSAIDSSISCRVNADCSACAPS